MGACDKYETSRIFDTKCFVDIANQNKKMNPAIFKKGALLLALFAILFTAVLVSWGQKQTPDNYGHQVNDTTPKKPARPGDGKDPDRHKKVRDLDDVLDELNEAAIDVDMDKIKEEISEALKKIDAEKIKMEIEKAPKEVDIAKIQKEVQESLAKADFEKIKAEITEALKELDIAKIQKEIQESMSKVDWDKMKEEMQQLKEVDMKKPDEDMKKLQEEMKELGPKMEKELVKAREEIEKAKKQIKEFKGFVDDLEKDGLISKKEGYTLKHRDGELFINGKKAADKTYNKYRSFLEKHRKFNMEKTDDDFDMDLD